VENGQTAAVILWPQSSMPGDPGRSISCGPGGAFEMSGVAPGDYYALPWIITIRAK
jgi:hypothetical protein